jgi:hypothetical protein
MKAIYFKNGRVRIKPVTDADFMSIVYVPEILSVPCGRYAEKPTLVYKNPAIGKVDCGVFNSSDEALTWLIDNNYLLASDTPTRGDMFPVLPEIVINF